MRIGAIIQARLDSKRLCHKVLRTIGVSPILDYVVRAARNSEKVDKVVLTTPDVALYLYAREVCGIWPYWYTGPRDPLAEYYNLAHALEFDPIVRLTADCPLLTGEIIDTAISDFLACGMPYGYNDTDGADVEVFTFAALDEAYRCAGPDEREHVTTYMRKHFVCATLRRPPGEFVSVDTPDDYQKVCELMREREQRGK